MAEILQFPNYVPDRYARLQAELAAEGLAVSEDGGAFKESGANVVYSYLPATGELTIAVNHAPFLRSMGSFCQQLRTAIESQE